VRYAYGVSAALLLGGAAVTAITGLPAGAQVAQNASQQVEAMIPRQGAPVSFADLVQQLQPAVVNIATRQRMQVAPNPLAQVFGGGGGAPQTREGGALGTGFLISADGYVVTNNHVVTADNTGVADSITVKLADGKEFSARLVGRDQQSDVAVLKIESPTPLPFVEFGDSDRARAGDWVVAIGNPFGLNGTVTAGIISAVQRNTGTGAFDHYIQSDASINSGNSGGPMFDMAGKVIGINNWIIAPGGGNVGLGFAIPANIARPIIEQLKSGTPIERGYLGVALVQISDDLAASLGVTNGQGEFVQTVIPGKGADLAGIRPGDVVTKVGEKDVTPAQTATSIIFNLHPGARVPIELLRNGRPVRVTATVGRRPTEDEMRQAQLSRDPGQQGTPQQPGEQFKPGQSPIELSLGLTVTPMTAEIANELGFQANSRGLVILGVDPSSDAAAKGLRRPFVILEAGGAAVGTHAELEAAIRAAQTAHREALLLRVQPPGSQAGFVPIRLRSGPAQ
jgi:serine protease Do